MLPSLRWFRFVAGGACAVALAVFAAVKLGDWEVRRLGAKIDALEREKAQLIDYAARLSASRRVAQVDVVSQRLDPAGGIVTTLLWQEIGPDGLRGKPLTLETQGALTYFEALVLKFDRQLVGEGDPQRGVSLALFRRVFGDRQSPLSAPEIDRAAGPPRDDGQAASLHDELWRRFWDFVDDPKLAAQYGVRVAQVEAPAAPLKPGQIWEVTLDASGGVNLRRVLK